MTSSIVFAPAARAASPARICLHGPEGSGKTYTSLMLMDALCGHQRFAVIDTERGKSAWYEGINGWQFNTWCPQAFSPEALIEGLGVAAGAGFPGVVIDSWSHFWNGVDGMLEQVDKRTASAHRQDKFSSGWKEMAPIEQRMLGAILSYPGHVIVTLRVKTEYVIDQIEKNGRTVSAPRKVGLKPIQRDGFGYEFDIIGALDGDCTLTIDKTRVPPLSGAIIQKPDPELAETIQAWLTKGEQLPGPLVYRQRALSVDASFLGLKELLDEVTAAGLANAPVVDGDGNPTVLSELVKARAVVLRPATQPTPRPKPEVPQASTQAEPSAKEAPANLEKAVDYILAAPNADEAAARMARVTPRPEAEADVTALVSGTDRETLGLREDETVKLLDLAAKVVDYCERHKVGPRVVEPAAA